MTLAIDIHCQDTICALATAHGKSALLLIRVSGPLAQQVKDLIFVPKKGVQKPFVATLGDVVERSPEHRVLDEAVCVYFPDQRSFTGEPSFELSLHGNPLIGQHVLALLQKSGCRLAGPGEFSLRAVLHNKLDLAQAESVADLIDAQSPQGMQVALRNLKGGIEQGLAPIRQALLSALCEIEARLDFPEEGIGERHKARILAELGEAKEALQALIGRSSQSTKLLQGFRIVLYGKPNAGKSTLLNALLGEERSLVHETPGTTRDVVEVAWSLDQIPVTLLDVAGIREGSSLHPVEAMGIERARKELERADLVLHLIDATQQEAEISPAVAVPVLPLLTKKDLLDAQGSKGEGLLISAHTGEGLDEVKQRLRALLVDHLPDTSGVVLTRLRQLALVEEALASLQQAIEGFVSGESDECVAFELRESGRALDELLGKQLNEEVLDLIFSRFCIGK